MDADEHRLTVDFHLRPSVVETVIPDIRERLRIVLLEAESGCLRFCSAIQSQFACGGAAEPVH